METRTRDLLVDGIQYGNAKSEESLILFFESWNELSSDENNQAIQ